MEKIILKIEDLCFNFHTYAGEVQAVRGVNISLNKGESLGIVGESGCGKSVTAKSIIKLNPDSNGYYKRGSIYFNGENILNLNKNDLLKMRANEIRMIFQDPMTSLNPTMKVGRQITEGILNAYPKIKKNEAKQIAIKALENTGMPNPEKRYEQYPHEFSGGMRQRAMIALALAVNPKLLICDEPTTALDVTLQAQILELIKNLQKMYDTAIIFITHDLGVVANIAENIAVMYAGKIVEYGSSRDIFYNCKHPYTWGILQSVPKPDADMSVPLVPILGTPPDLFNPPKGCAFAARCSYALEVCRKAEPPTYEVNDKHKVCCWLYHKMAPKVINPITKEEVSL